MRLTRQSDGSTLEIDVVKSRLGEGGEAVVCAVNSAADLVAKLYHPTHRTREREAKLTAMLEQPPIDPMAAHGHVSIAWPFDSLRENGKFIGFLMPRVRRQRPVFEFYHPSGRKQAAPLFHYGYLHRTALNIAASLHTLHEKGIVVGDFNESNILVAPTALVTLVDCDSFQVRDLAARQVFYCPVGKIEYTPPELQRKDFSNTVRHPEHDRFGLAVLLFQLLMEGTFPFGGVYPGGVDAPERSQAIEFGHFPWARQKGLVRPPKVAPEFTLIDPELRRLFHQAFEEGLRKPELRPTAGDWQFALREAEKRLKPCGNNPQHIYGQHLAQCPWCARRDFLRGRDPFPSATEVSDGKHLAPIPNLPKPQTVRRNFMGQAVRPANRYPAPRTLPRPQLYPPPRQGQTRPTISGRRPTPVIPASRGRTITSAQGGCSTFAWIAVVIYILVFQVGNYFEKRPILKSSPAKPGAPIVGETPKNIPQETENEEEPPPLEQTNLPRWKPSIFESPNKPPAGLPIPQRASWQLSRDGRTAVVERDGTPGKDAILELFRRAAPDQPWGDAFGATDGGFGGAVWMLYRQRSRFAASIDSERFALERLQLPAADGFVTVRLRPRLMDDSLRPVLWTAGYDLEESKLVPFTARPHQKLATFAPAVRLSSFSEEAQAPARFVESVLQARNSRHEPSIRRTLATSVSWRDLGFVAAESVIEDLRRTWAEWPQSREDFMSELHLEPEPGTNGYQWNVRYPMRWRLENPKRGEWQEGTAEIKLRIVRDSPQVWRMLEETSFPSPRIERGKL